ncbi:MAG: tyrosine--tRNA ligase, partial [Negativicutes bacterium]|nr:tyrosine--tRNA ligase [Negativicutes bacterium]
RRLGSLKDKEINTAKQVLAYEVTKLIHGQEEADKAQQAALALFAGAGSLDNAPTASISADKLGSKLIDVLAETNIVASKSEARRLII